MKRTLLAISLWMLALTSYAQPIGRDIHVLVAVDKYELSLDALSRPVQFSGRDIPGLLSAGEYHISTNGRSFLLVPFTIDGGRNEILNQTWLSWGYGGLIGRELLWNGVEHTGFNSLSFGGGAWALVDLGSAMNLTFSIGASGHVMFNEQLPTSIAGSLMFRVSG